MRQCNKGRRARLRPDDAHRECCLNVGVFDTEIKLLVTREHNVLKKPRPFFFFLIHYITSKTQICRVLQMVP